MMLDWLKKKEKKEVTVSSRKSYGFGSINAAVSSTFLDSNVPRLSTTTTLRWYTVAAPVATAIDLVVDEFKTLQPILLDENEVIKEDEFLTFLSMPNDAQTQEDMFKAYGSYFEITGEAYLVATGDVNRVPAELIVINPRNVEVQLGKDGFIQAISVTNSEGSPWKFTRDDEQFRFFTKNRDAEIWPVQDFNSNQNGRGASKLNAVQFEVQQYLEQATHNLMRLRNEMRPSGMFLFDNELSDDQFEGLQAQTKDFLTGSHNAGQFMIVEGGGQFQELGSATLDMDFEKLKKDLTIAIFNRYKVPLPLISPDTMTMNNMEVAKLNLYDNAVLPLSQRLFQELVLFLGDRFGIEDDVKLVPDIDRVPALQPRRNEQLKLQKELGVLTVDELRSMIGREALETGGDFVYLPNNLVPIGNDAFTEDNRDEPRRTTRKAFVELMQGQVDTKGNRIYTDGQINQYADEQELTDED